ncbi:MAG: hypothetical protein ACFFDT_33010, partial [Candidatus Hodarchaeota archaeon]
ELLEFLATIKPDCTGHSSALVRTIEANTGLTREEIHRMALEAEHDGLVETIRLSLSGAEGLLAVRLSSKGREWLKVCDTDS